MEIDTIYNMDCLEGMKMIPDGSVDCIICDLPYGTMKNWAAGTDRWVEGTHDWDEVIPTDKLFEQYERVLRVNGVAILFSQEPYTNHLRGFKHKECNFNFEFAYSMIWKKNHFANGLNAKQSPLQYFEDLSVFFKRYDSEGLHPLRDYARKVLDYLGMKHKEVVADFERREVPHPTRVSHFLSPDSFQFGLCTAETYQMFIDFYGIDKMEGFLSYAECEKINSKYQRVFNLPEGKGHMSNILEFHKDTDGFHPTQKPVALIRRLIQTYSNEGDTILDNCMGSGTTAIASIREKRHFIGFELNAEYYEKAMKRIKLERQQLTLF